MHQKNKDQSITQILENLSSENKEVLEIYPGDSEKRQPVHTVYGGAHLFKFDTAQKIGQIALKSFKENAPTAQIFREALGFSDSLQHKIYERVESKLEREALEDFRIDFEDGFGIRPDAEEDAVAIQAAQEVAKGMQEKTLPPFIGIRIKTLSEELKKRSIRTLDLFLGTLLNETKGKLPQNFVVTLPKITSKAQVETLVEVFELLEKENNLKAGSLKMEFMVETPQTLFNPKGKIALPSMVKEAKGRCVAAHFGTYDFTASINITADYQIMDHPSCDFARHIMKVALSGTGLWLSDGATNVMPVGPHRAEKGKSLSESQIKENQKVIHRVWRLNYEHIQHSLKHAYYQGWDLHPAQIPVRYGALYAFFLQSLESASVRLKNFIEQAAKATLVGDVFDDAATGQGLLNFFLKALNCGAITEEEITKVGLTLDEVRTRSFLKILEGRKSKK